MFCPSCGTQSPSDQKTCKNCGATLGAAGDAQTVPAVAKAPAPQAFQPPAPAPYAPPQAPTQYAFPPMPTAYPPPPPGYGSYPVMAPQAYRLYDTGAVGLATFFGSPLAGAFLMATNYKRLGKSSNRYLAVLLGAVVTAILIYIGWNHTNVAWIFAIAGLAGTMQSARSLQGTAVSEHVAHGGELGSRWKAFGVAVVTLAVVFVALLAVLMVVNPGTVTIGTMDRVHYSGTATKDQAIALGNALKADGFFQNRGARVRLHKGSKGTAISFVVSDGTWNDPKMVSGFEVVTRDVASTVGGLPIDMRLVNTWLTVEKEEMINALPATAPQTTN